jgi:hypothetical protein
MAFFLIEKRYYFDGEFRYKTLENRVAIGSFACEIYTNKISREKFLLRNYFKTI